MEYTDWKTVLPELKRRYKTVAFRSAAAPKDISPRYSTQDLSPDADFTIVRHKFSGGALVLVLTDGYLMFE